MQDAAAEGNTELVALLLSRGADLSLNNYLPIRLAAAAGHLTTLRLMVDAVRVTDPDRGVTFATALDSSAVTVLSVLTGHHGVHVSGTVNLLETAARWGHMAGVEFLVAACLRDAQWQERVFEALEAAMGSGHLTVVRFLATHEPNLTSTFGASFRCRLGSVARKGDSAMVHLVLETFKPPPEIADAAVNEFTSGGHPEMVPMLIALRPSDPVGPDEPLHLRPRVRQILSELYAAVSMGHRSTISTVSHWFSRALAPCPIADTLNRACAGMDQPDSDLGVLLYALLEVELHAGFFEFGSHLAQAASQKRATVCVASVDRYRSRYTSGSESGVSERHSRRSCCGR